MNQKTRKIFAGLGYWIGVIVFASLLGGSLQLARAWVSAPGNHNANIGAPLTTGARDQRKTGGGIIVDGNTLGIWAKGSGYGVYGSNAAGDYGTLGNSGYGGIFSGATTGAYGVGGTFGVRGYVPTSGSQGFLGYHSVGAYGAGEGSGVQGYNTTNLSNGYLGYGYDGYNIGVFGASSVRAVYGYNTAYGSGATLGYYDSGLYARNSANYYTYLAKDSWGALTNGNMQANDYYIAKIGKWASQLGGSCNGSKCQGANNCIKTDGTCGRLQIEVAGGSNLGVSCTNQRDFVYPDGENPAYFDRSCSFDSGRLTIDVHARVYCRGKYAKPLANQGGAACVNSDGTYGWVQAYFQSGLTNGECGIDWSWTPYDLKPDSWYHLHTECGDGGAAGRRDYNMDLIWRCI